MTGDTGKTSVLERVRELYDRMEHDSAMEKAFLEDRDAFLRDNGFDPGEVEEALRALLQARVAGFQDVIQAADRKLQD